jgi:hypothetical protein
MKDSKPQAHPCETRGVINFFRDPQTFLAQFDPFRELAQFSQTARQSLPTGDSREVRKDGEAKPLANPITDEHVDIPPQDDGRLAVVPRDVEGVPQQQIHGDLLREVHASPQGESPLSSLHSSFLLVRQIMTVGNPVRDPAEPPLIVERSGQNLRFLHVVEDAAAVS